MKFSKKELILVMYLVTKVVSIIASYLDPELKDIFKEAVNKFIVVINDESKVIE